MRYQIILGLALAGLLALVASAHSAPPKFNPDREPEIRDVFPPSPAKSAVDTTYLMGDPGSWDGTFDSPTGQPDWHGWTGEDLSSSTENHWHVSTYQADQIEGKDPGNHAMYCGDENIPACYALDIMGGYGPNWLEEIEWRQAVTDTSQSVSIHLTGLLRYDTEFDYDFVYLLLQRGQDLEVLGSWSGTGIATLDYSVVLDPGEFSGPSNDEVRLAWRFRSDASGDDYDCINKTSGACQIDDLEVSLHGVPATFDDFEPGNPVNWNPDPVQGVGDFSSLRNNLQGVRPGLDVNTSYQVNFVDDGIVVPGTGGTLCIEWCYGPGGYILNHDRGISEGPPEFTLLNNQVVSPPLAWPGDQDGALLAFDAYLHEPLTSTSSGMVAFWKVRSTASSDPDDLQHTSWVNRGAFLPTTNLGELQRFEEPVHDLLVQGRQWVQIALGVYQLGPFFGIDGPNGTPAPYFDNVAFKVWDPVGPTIKVTARNRFGDAFPEAGVLDPSDPAANWCRVDRVLREFLGARGDSLVAEILPIRKYATVVEPPWLNWVMECNPVFDAVRPSLPDGQGILRGAIAGGVALDGTGQTRPDVWAFDLPDTGFFFPGDQLRYYITASDQQGGDIRTAVWPPDTTGVQDFSDASPYPYQATIRALPSVAQSGPGQFTQPATLLIDDTNSDATVRSLWLEALAGRGLPPESELDILTIFVTDDLSYYVNATLLSGYRTIIYSAGRTFSSLKDTAPSVISDWLDTGDKNALFAGENLVSRLAGGGEPDGPLLKARLGVEFQDSRITDLNGGVWDLMVAPYPGNAVYAEYLEWQINAASPVLRLIDALTPTGPGQAAAALDPAGSPGGPYAATVTVEDMTLYNRTVVLPFDLDAIDGMNYGSGKSDKAYTPSTYLAYYLLVWLGAKASSAPDDFPGAGQVVVSAHPNPFNPATTIAFELPQAADVSLNIFDLHGRLVRQLLDEHPYAPGSHQQVWDGQNGKGQAASSGMYFYFFSSGDQKRVGKLTLLK